MNIRYYALLLAMFLSFIMTQQTSGQSGPANRTSVKTLPAEIEIIKDVVYGTGGERPLKMHLLRPKNLPEKPMPVLVWIHGGRWLEGNKDTGINRLIPFVNRGYVGASIEYRLSQEAKFPAQIEDCKAAIRFLRANAKKFHLNSNHIGAWGESAGGHLAALLGTTGKVKELEGDGGNLDYSSHVNAVCDWYGPTNFLKMREGKSIIDHDKPDSPESLLIGGPIQETKERVSKADPIRYITKHAPPFLIMHGEKDSLVPINQSELLYDALKKSGIDVTYHFIPDAGHGGDGFKRPEVIKTVEEFFDKHFK
jgi:acetyl esterase/lipase